MRVEENFGPAVLPGSSPSTPAGADPLFQTPHTVHLLNTSLLRPTPYAPSSAGLPARSLPPTRGRLHHSFPPPHTGRQAKYSRTGLIPGTNTGLPACSLPPTHGRSRRNFPPPHIVHPTTHSPTRRTPQALASTGLPARSLPPTRGRSRHNFPPPHIVHPTTHSPT